MLNRQKRKFDQIPSAVQLKQQPIIFQTPQMHAILKLKQKYEKNVQQAIHVIQDINFNKMPQKCLQHNNNYTLYCQNDQKPLCASCMYQNQLHKLHKVHPLNNCFDLLKRDCDKFQKQLSYIVQNIGGLVKHVNQGIQKLDHQFPHLVWKIEENYKQLHDYLVDRQKQHINELKYYKQRMKYQHGALSTQLNKIALFIQQKIEQYSRKHQFDILLVKRNIFDCLKNSAKIVGEQLNIKDEQQRVPKLHFQVFKQIQDFIYAKLPKLFTNVSNKQEGNGLGNNNFGSRKRTNSKSKQNFIGSPKANPHNNRLSNNSSKNILRQERSNSKGQRNRKISSEARSDSKGRRRTSTQIKKTPTKPPLPKNSTNSKTPIKKQNNLSRSKSNIKGTPPKDTKSSKKNSLSKLQKQSPDRHKLPSSSPQRRRA